jgi:hypothetical protein
MLAWKHVELPLKYALVTYVTYLLRIDRNISVSLFPLFLSELLPALGGLVAKELGKLGAVGGVLVDSKQFD